MLPIWHQFVMDLKNINIGHNFVELAPQEAIKRSQSIWRILLQGAILLIDESKKQ